jgi:hypothetical protein
MNFEFDKKSKQTICIAETSDSCVTCDLFDVCPLVLAIRLHVVYPSAETITLEGCPMFEPVTPDEG